MQNQNLWAESYSSPGHSGKGWDISDNPEDEVNNSCVINPASQSAEEKNDIFTYRHSGVISPDPFDNMASLIDSSSNTSTGTVSKDKHGLMFSSNSSFIESEHSSQLSCKYSGETLINQINGEPQFETVASSEFSDNKDEAVSSVSAAQRCHKRRNSLPSNYPNYRKRLSIESEVQSLCGADTSQDSDSNNSYDVSECDGNEDTSWANCYSPYRKRPTSVVSSERGAESLIDKLFNNEQKKRYEALRKKSTRRMDNKRRKNKHINFGEVYKSFMEGVTHSSQNHSVFTNVDDASQKDSKMNKADIKVPETNDDFTVHEITDSVDSKGSCEIVFVADPVPEETDTDLISESESLSVNAVSKDTVPMDCDVDDGSTSENILVQTPNDYAIQNVTSDANDNLKGSEQTIFLTNTISEETDVNMVSQSDCLSVQTDSGQQDVISTDGFLSENTFASAASCDSVSVSTDDNCHQGLLIADSVPKEIDDDMLSETGCLSAKIDSKEQDVSIGFRTVEPTSEEVISSNKGESANADDDSKDSQQIIFLTNSVQDESDNIISESGHIAIHSESTQAVTSMDYDADELTSDNVLVPIISSDKLSTIPDDTLENSQQVIFIPNEAGADCLVSHTNSNEQHILAMNCDAGQPTSEDVLVYVTCSDGYRLCKVSTDADVSSNDSQQVTFITNSVPKEIDGLISDSNCFTINSDLNQQDVAPLDYKTINDVPASGNVLIPVPEVLLETPPFASEHQNISLTTETDKRPFYSPVVDKGHINSSAGNLTNDEISDSLDKIFTSATASDESIVMYSIPEEQREVPFDFDGEKLISLDANISTEASVDNFSVIQGSSQDNELHNQVENLETESDLGSENKRSISSAEYHLESKSSSHINQENLSLADDKQNIMSVSENNSHLNNQIERHKDLESHINVCSGGTEKVFEIQPSHLDDAKMEICYEGEKIFLNSCDDPVNVKTGLYENVKASCDDQRFMENICEDQKRKSEIFIMDTTTCEKNKSEEIGKLLANSKSASVFHNSLEDISDTSPKKHKLEPDLVNLTESSDKLPCAELKNQTSLNKHLSDCVENSETETSNINLSFESQNCSYACRPSKARKSTSKASILKPSKNEVLKDIENNITNETFDLNESKENFSCHGSFVAQEQVSQNFSTLNYILSDSEVENIPLVESDSNFCPDLEMKSVQKCKSSLKTHFNGKHKNGTAKKSFSKSSYQSSDEANNCDIQNSVLSSDSELDDEISKHKQVIQYLSDNNTETNNPESPVEVINLPVFHNKVQNINQRSALKTFKKPFTVAKKSVTEKTSFKTVFQSYFGIRTAKKTCNKSPNKKLLNTNLDESSSSVEELSADEARNSTVIWSPVKDLQLKVCSCSAVEVPCLCNGEQLQTVCEAEDTIDEKIVLCTKNVSQQYLLTPSSEIKHRAFCDIHLWRLKNHQCCPKCGTFCTQGTFLCCSNELPVKGGKGAHFFHPSCFLLPDSGLPPGCPHCCTFSDFKNVHFSLTENVSDEALLQTPNKGSEKQNITEGLENYSILMTIQSDALSNVKTTSAPQTQDLKTMLIAITKEPSLRLRPTGKCLFNPIKVGDVKKVIRLIANGVDPNHKFSNHKNNTPLHIAAFYGCIGIVHILIQYGASIDAVNDDLETPFILAVEKDQMAVVRYLIHAGAQIDVKDENGLTAFHVACKNHSKEMAEFLYNTEKFDINLQDDGGWTPLVWACEHSFGDLVQWLLEHGADPNVRDNEENTALHWAACSGNSEILEMLLDNGCNLSFVNQRGDSALHIAARKDNWTCVKLLLEKNALLDGLNRDGQTPIMCCDEDSKSLRILKKHSISSATLDNESFQQNVVYRDISRGSEKYPIQAVNEVDQEEFIMDFRYINRNCYASNITVISTVDSMQKCYCKDNCSSSDCTCTRISKCWYDMDGCLLADFDMYDPPSLYECNKTCHCPKTCINRVVQRGLRYPLQLFRTLNRGWGVRSLKDLVKGTFVCEYVGEVISEEEIALRTDDTYLFDLESKTGDNCIDGRFYGNVSRFINHSCEPNLVSVRVFVEHQDLNFPRIAFFTMKDVKAFEELCFDYGAEFWIAKSHTVLCTCNSSLCKYSKDSIDDTLQAYISEKEEALSSMDVQPS